MAETALERAVVALSPATLLALLTALSTALLLTALRIACLTTLPTALTALLAALLTATALLPLATAGPALALRVAELLVTHARVRAAADPATADLKATTPALPAPTALTTLRSSEPSAAMLGAVDLRQQASTTVLLRRGDQVLQHVVELEVRVGGTVRHHQRH